MKKNKIKIPPNKVKAIILSITIAIVLSSFVIYFIQTIHPSPKYEDYCEKESSRILIPENKEIIGGTCATVSPNFRDECCINKGYESYNPETGECEGIVDYIECQEKYETARDKYKLRVFIIAIITGLLSISVGIILILPSVSSGLMIGGTFLTFYGTAIYWSDLTNWLRTLILGAVLGILIWLGYKKLQN